MAVPRIGSRLASFVGLSEVLFALGFAWLFLSEVPAPIQFVGGALILVGRRARAAGRRVSGHRGVERYDCRRASSISGATR